MLQMQSDRLSCWCVDCFSRHLTFLLPHTGCLQIALETKAQQLCDDTRAQYEQMLQRQETRHEQQQTSLQHKLQQVLQTSISLGEHEQLMAMQTEAHKREREQHTQRQTQELSQLQEQWKQYWQLRLRDLEHQHEQQLEQLEERLAQSELAAAEALHWAKQHELGASC